jgi:hypothetical protein
MQIRFAPFVLDLGTRELTREGMVLHVSPKAFELLAVLAVDRPRAIAKSVLLERVWPRTFVSEGNLSNLITELRSALDDDARCPRWIRTVHRFGYAFAATDGSGTAAVGGDTMRVWIEWDGRKLPLRAGNHLVGRDAASVHLVHPSVSRHHARLVIGRAGGATRERRIW